MDFMKIFMIITTVMGWARKAFADGKIDTEEAIELITILAGVLIPGWSIGIPGTEVKQAAASNLNSGILASLNPVKDAEERKPGQTKA